MFFDGGGSVDLTHKVPFFLQITCKKKNLASNYISGFLYLQCTWNQPEELREKQSEITQGSVPKESQLTTATNYF